MFFFLEQKINNQTQTKICLTISIYSRHNLLHFKTIWNIYKNKNCGCKKYVNINHKYFSTLNTPRKKYLCTQHFTLVYQRRGINSPLYLFFQIAVVILFIWRRRRSQYTLTIVCCVVVFFIGGPHTTEFHLEPHWRKWEQIFVWVCVNFDYIDEYMYVCGYNFENKIFIHKIYKQLLKINYKNRCQKNYYFFFVQNKDNYFYLFCKKTREQQNVLLYTTRVKKSPLFFVMYLWVYSNIPF